MSLRASHPTCSFLCFPREIFWEMGLVWCFCPPLRPCVAGEQSQGRYVCSRMSSRETDMPQQRHYFWPREDQATTDRPSTLLCATRCNATFSRNRNRRINHHTGRRCVRCMDLFENILILQAPRGCLRVFRIAEIVASATDALHKLRPCASQLNKRCSQPNQPLVLQQKPRTTIHQSIVEPLKWRNNAQNYPKGIIIDERVDKRCHGDWPGDIERHQIQHKLDQNTIFQHR